MPVFNTYTEDTEMQDEDLFLMWDTTIGKVRRIKKESLQATDVLSGLLRFATQAEVDGGVFSDVAVSPATLQAKISAIQSGLQWKTSCKVSTTGNITLSGAQTIDGVSVVAGDRVLVKNQGTTTQNGIYVAAAGAWSRAADANAGTELQSATVPVDQGTANADTSWRQTTDNVVIGTSPVVFESFGAAIPDASESTKGKVQLATLQEVKDGISTKVPTPDKLIDVFAQKLNASNPDTGIDQVSINAVSGVAIFTQPISQNQVLQFTINNNFVEGTTYAILGLRFTPSITDGMPQLINYQIVNGAIILNVTNIGLQTTEAPIEIHFQLA